MNKTILTAALTALACLSLCAEGGKLGKVSFFMGAAKIRAAAKEEWKPVKMNGPIFEGDRIQTAKAEVVEIQVADGSLLRIAEESDVAIECPNPKVVAANVKNGKIWANIKKLSKRSYNFEVTSGTATAAIRGTVVRMDNSPADSLTKVLVYDGKVDVGPGADLAATQPAKQPGERKEVSGPMEIPGPFEVSLMDWVSIVKGQQINVRPDGKYHKFKFDQTQDAQDSWVKFNQERDKVASAEPVSTEPKTEEKK